MDVAIKQIHIDADRAARLAELAAGKGVTEDALIGEALDMLFHETAMRDELRADWQMLRQMEAELGLMPAYIPVKINQEDIVSVAATPIAPQRICALEREQNKYAWKRQEVRLAVPMKEDATSGT